MSWCLQFGSSQLLYTLVIFPLVDLVELELSFLFLRLLLNLFLASHVGLVVALVEVAICRLAFAAWLFVPIAE